MHDAYADKVIEQLIALGERTDLIRAMVLTSSLCNPGAAVDILSDFDVQIFAEDPAPLVTSDDWLQEIGQIIALWRAEWGEGTGHRWMRMVMLHDGTKMDILLGYLEDLRAHSSRAELSPGYDIGYKVLLDKDNVTRGIAEPTHRAYILERPTAAQYMDRMEAFWMDSTYVAKFLWRGDVMAAKTRLDDLANGEIRELMEWLVASERGWNWRPGVCGRGIQNVLHPDLYRELLDSYAGGSIDELWQSLFRTAALCRRVATQVADRLGFQYPHELDKRVSVYHQVVRGLDQNATRQDLARLLEARYGQCS